MSLSNTAALLEAVFGKPSEFVRTPKYGAGLAEYGAHKRHAESKRKKKRQFLPYLEFAFGTYMTVCAVLCLLDPGSIMAAPFMIIFAVGFFYVSILTFQGNAARAAEPTAETVKAVE